MLSLILSPGCPDWPRALDSRLGDSAPDHLTALGDTALLAPSRVALFCSSRCPGDAILRAFDAARALRDRGDTVIGGFHSPVERECLRILLRGAAPLIICPARGLDGMRLLPDWRTALDAGRLLLLSPFPGSLRRGTRAIARRRNDLVAALADVALIIHAEPEGETARVAALLAAWSVPAA